MSSTLYALGRWCFRHHWRVIVGWLLVVALAVAGAVGMRGAFDNSFTLPGTQSQQALDQLRATFPEMAGISATMVVVVDEGRTLDDPDVRRAIDDTVERLDDLDVVDSVRSPYDYVVDGQISADRTAGLAQVMLSVSMTDFTSAQKAELTRAAADLQAALPGSTVRMGGEAFNATIPTVGVVEVLGVGVALVVLVLTMGSFVAAGLPLISALVGVGVSMAVILVVSGLTSVNSTTPMLALMLGLAVGIDYALFIVSRHREQLADGLAPEESAARAVATSGSAVVFAGMTVFIALIGLVVARIPFLTTMGIAAAMAIAVAVAVALTLVPALTGLAGARLRPRVRTRRRRRVRVAAGHGGAASAWWVRTVTRAPVLTIVAVVVALGALALPARHMQLALPNAGQNERGTSSREAYDLTAQKFGPGHNGPLVVTAEIVGSDDPVGVMDSLKEDIEAMPGVAMVALATPNRTADTGVVQVIPTTGPDDPATNDLVRRIRDKAPDWQKRLEVPTAVTGYTAVAIDVSDRLGSALLPFGVFVIGLSLVLLTMVFRSIVVPIKATAGYLLSVLACFGATTAVFTDGVGARLINVELPGPVISFLPIIVMGILFGLSMDYEVFLVSRMREDWVHGTPARAAVHTGFVGSAMVVVAAAVIMVSVFAFFVPDSDRGSLQPIAFALTAGVALDAFVVRMTLVPAVMFLLGERAWHLPRWLERRLPSLDVEGEVLARELALRDWPAPGDPHVIWAEGLVAGDTGHRLHSPVDLRVAPGQVHLVTGETPERSGLLLALGGRLPVAEGRARVAGHLLADHPGKVRRSVRWIDLDRPGAAQDLERLIGERPAGGRAIRTEGPVIIDNADRPPNLRTREQLARLVEVAPAREMALVLGATAAGARGIFLPARYIRTTLTPYDSGEPDVTGEQPSEVSHPILQGSES